MGKVFACAKDDIGTAEIISQAVQGRQRGDLASKPKQTAVFDIFESCFLLTPQMGVHLLSALPAGNLIDVQMLVIHEVHANLFIYMYLLPRHAKAEISSLLYTKQLKAVPGSKNPCGGPNPSHCTSFPMQALI